MKKREKEKEPKKRKDKNDRIIKGRRNEADVTTVAITNIYWDGTYTFILHI